MPSARTVVIKFRCHTDTWTYKSEGNLHRLLVQVLAWRRTGDKPLHEAMLTVVYREHKIIRCCIIYIYIYVCVCVFRIIFQQSKFSTAEKLFVKKIEIFWDGKQLNPAPVEVEPTTRSAPTHCKPRIIMIKSAPWQLLVFCMCTIHGWHDPSDSKFDKYFINTKTHISYRCQSNIKIRHINI